MGSKLGSYSSEHKQLYTMDGCKATHYINKENDKLSDELHLMMTHSKAFKSIYQYSVNELILNQSKAHGLKQYRGAVTVMY
jgi:hypothetical protein